MQGSSCTECINFWVTLILGDVSRVLYDVAAIYYSSYGITKEILIQELLASQCVTIWQIRHLGFLLLVSPNGVPLKLFIATMTWYHLTFTCRILFVVHVDHDSVCESAMHISIALVSFKFSCHKVVATMTTLNHKPKGTLLWAPWETIKHGRLLTLW